MAWLLADFTVNPTNGGAVQDALGEAKKTYFFWTNSYRRRSRVTLTIICERFGERCLASPDEAGERNPHDRALQTNIISSVSASGDTVTASIEMGAALDADSISTLPFSGTSNSIQYNGATLAITAAMGSYRWRCVQG